MRVLFISVYNPYGKHGTGPGNHLRNLSEALQNLGCEVHILMPGKETSVKEKNGIILHLLKSHSKLIGRDILFSLSCSKLVNQICDEYGIDVVHGESASSFGYALLNGRKRPYVVTIHSTAFGEISSYSTVPFSNITFGIARDVLVVQPIWHFLTKIECKFADRVVADSESIAEEARRYYRLKVNKVIPIYCGVKLTDTNERSVENQNARNILFVGRLVWRKGAWYLIDAIPRVLTEFKDTKIKIAGSGEQKLFLEERTKKIGIDKSIQFLGSVSAEDLQHLYSEADIYVQPSLYEPLGIAVLEAMSMGKPIIASRVGGIPEMVTSGKEGLLVEPGNSFQLGEAIIHLISDSSLRRRYGRNARRKVETEFTWQKIAQQTLNLYEDLCSTKK